MTNNEEHLAKLKQGIEYWNEWWKRSSSSLTPDLTKITKTDLCQIEYKKVILIRANLSGVDLSDFDLSGVDLSGADLSEANLRGANLSRANLSCANLSGADLSETDLSSSICVKTYFTGADLSNADLWNSYLSGAYLRKANLSRAYLDKADLSEANLSEANLSGAKLNGADLFKAHLFEVNLSEAYLNDAKLSEAKLFRANLRGAWLSATQALATDFQEATLTGACIQDWNINSSTNFDGVICQYVYYLQDDKLKRLPDSREELFTSGEFSRIFQADAANQLTELYKTLRKNQPNYTYELVVSRPDSRRLLIQALDNPAQRLILICPWLRRESLLEDKIFEKMEAFLKQGGQIDVGWGYWDDLKDVELRNGLFSRQKIWEAVKGKSTEWKYNALQDLRKLEQKYTNHFNLKLLGTHEKYLVWSRNFHNSWAMLGSHNFLTSNSRHFSPPYSPGSPRLSYPRRELGLTTNDPEIVRQLIERFDKAKNLEE